MNPVVSKNSWIDFMQNFPAGFLSGFHFLMVRLNPWFQKMDNWKSFFSTFVLLLFFKFSICVIESFFDMLLTQFSYWADDFSWKQIGPDLVSQSPAAFSITNLSSISVVLVFISKESPSIEWSFPRSIKFGPRVSRWTIGFDFVACLHPALSEWWPREGLKKSAKVHSIAVLFFSNRLGIATPSLDLGFVGVEPYLRSGKLLSQFEVKFSDEISVVLNLVSFYVSVSASESWYRRLGCLFFVFKRKWSMVGIVSDKRDSVSCTFKVGVGYSLRRELGVMRKIANNHYIINDHLFFQGVAPWGWSQLRFQVLDVWNVLPGLWRGKLLNSPKIAFRDVFLRR